MIVCAMLTAAAVALDRFVPLAFTDSVKITFAFVPALGAAVYYGPAEAAVVWGLSDLIGALLFPRGVYFPMFTVTAALKGFVFGIFIQKGKSNLTRAVAPSLISNFVIGLFIDTIWISILYSSKTYWGYFVTRIPEFVVLTALCVIFIPIADEIVSKIRKSIGKKG